MLIRFDHVADDFATIVDKLSFGPCRQPTHNACVLSRNTLQSAELISVFAGKAELAYTLTELSLGPRPPESPDSAPFDHLFLFFFG